MSRGKQVEVSAIRRELAGELEVRLSRLAPDGGTDEGERRQQLIWQKFRIRNGTTAVASVLGDLHPDFLEGQEAAQMNTAELFESELISASVAGLPMGRLATVHSHYFGVGFERSVGKRLRQFVSERYEYDEKTGRVKAPAKILEALRKMEARELLREEREWQQKEKEKMFSRNEEDGKRKNDDGRSRDDNMKRQRMFPANALGY